MILHRVGRLVGSLLPWMLGGLALATGLARLAPLGWPFELFSHFRVQYLATALLLAVLLAARRRAVPAALALALAGWHALPGVRGSLAAPPSLDCAGPAFTVATVNVHFTNTSRAPLLAWLASSGADLVVVQEVTSAWGGEFAALDAYPHRRVLAREDAYGIAVLSRRPLESVTPLDLAADGLPSLAGVVDVGGQRVRFLGLHTRWPITPSLTAARDRALRAAAQRARAGDLPVVLLGDLNVTPDAPAYERLLGEGGLRDVMQGRGWRPTWAGSFWPLALRIDHVLVSSGVCVEHAEVGPSLGSDHRPVLARLRARPQPSPRALPGPAGTARRERAGSLGGQGLAGRGRELAAALEQPAAEPHHLGQ